MFKTEGGARYPVEFEQGCQTMQKMEEGTEKLIQKIRKHCESYNGGGGNVYLIESVGDAAAGLAAPLSSNNTYTYGLIAMSKCQKAMALLERNYQQELDERVLKRYREWLKQESGKFNKELQTLNKKRKDMDAAVARHRKEEAKADLKAKADKATAEHDTQYKLVQTYLNKLNNYTEEHRKILVAFLEAQKRRMDKSIDEIDLAIKEFNRKT